MTKNGIRKKIKLSKMTICKEKGFFLKETLGIMKKTIGGSNVKEPEKKVKGYGKDILLILGIFGIGVILLLYTYLREQKQPMVVVRVDGKVIKEFSLDASIHYQIEGIGGTNTLCIADGSVWLTEADCPDKICVQTGKIRYAGQSIICLPHKAVVEIKEAEDEE